MGNTTNGVTLKVRLLCALCSIVVGAIAILGAPAPFVQRAHSEGQECHPEYYPCPEGSCCVLGVCVAIGE